jgi:hypothetical protein
MNSDDPINTDNTRKGKPRGVTDTKPCPNWDLINREGIDDGEFLERWDHLSSVYTQMLKSPKRRLIPETAWDSIVLFSLLRAITEWKGNGEGKCPLKNYAWSILNYTSIQWWTKNKNGIINSVELDKAYMTQGDK